MTQVERGRPMVQLPYCRAAVLLVAVGLALSGCAVRGGGSGTTPGPDKSAISTSPSSGSAVSVSTLPSMPSSDSSDGPTSPAGVIPTSDGVADQSVSVAAQTRSTVNPTSSGPTTVQPPLGADSGSLLVQLDGRTFALTGTFTDAGGAELMTPGLDFRITFAGSTATVAGDCTLRYPKLRAVSSASKAKIDFGNAVGDTPCAVGSDPGNEPAGELFVDFEGGTLHLNTGAVGWNFQELVPTDGRTGPGPSVLPPGTTSGPAPLYGGRELSAEETQSDHNGHTGLTCGAGGPGRSDLRHDRHQY